MKYYSVIQRNRWFSKHEWAVGIHVHVRAGTGRANAWWLEVVRQGRCWHRGMRRLGRTGMFSVRLGTSFVVCTSPQSLTCTLEMCAFYYNVIIPP